ncbi:hypothetical protein IJE86_04225 [bacterium]|nr:hypothetical protein [bacterium]
MNINNNLQNLYAAQQQKAAYNDYQAKTKKGEKVEDNLFGTADKNGDNKVNKNDLTAINNEITKLTKDKLLYDIDGDKKVTLTDLMEFDVNTDIDGDGKVSDAEKKFLEEQKNTLINQLKAQKDAVEYDLNGDGKVDAKDASAFLQLTSKYNQTQDATTAKYLKDFHAMMNVKVFNFDGGQNVTLNDLAIVEQRLDIAKAVVNKDSKTAYLSDKYEKQADINGDGLVVTEDVKLWEDAVKSITAQKGWNIAGLESRKDSYDEAAVTYKNAQNAEAEAKTAQANAQKAESTAKSKYTTAQKAETTAKSKYTTAQKAETTAKTKYDAAVKAEAAAKEAYEKASASKKKALKAKYDAAVKATKTAKANYDKAVTATKTAKANYDKAVTTTKTAKANYDNAVTATKTAKTAYSEAITARKTAKTNFDKEAKQYDNIDHYFAKKESLEEAENKEIVNNYTAAVKQDTKELTAAEKAQTSAQSAYNSADKALTTAQNKLASLKNQALKATGSKLNSLNKQIQTLENTTIPNLEKTKAEKLEALNKAKATVATKKAELLGTKNINNSLETTDTKLKAALENLTDEEQLLIKEQNIDITETYPDGSPMYLLAKGKKDGQYHLYKFDAPNSNIASSVIRHSMGYNSASYNIIANGNGRVRIRPGTDSSSNNDFEIIIPKKTEKTVYETVVETVTLPAEKELTEVMDEITELYKGVLDKNWKIGEKPDGDILKSIQASVVTDYYNGKIGKADISKNIANELTAQGFNGQAILDALAKNTVDGTELNNLINKLTGAIAKTKPTTEEQIKTIEKKVTTLGSETSNKKYFTSSPLSFDLNGDGVKTSETKVKFDIDGDGKIDVINDSADAVLAFDADGDGIVGEDGKEVFGDNTDLDGDGKKDGFANGFDALKALAMKEGLIDGKSDNTLNAQDIAKLQEKYGLAMKSGYNGEAKSLTDLGITSINLGTTNETQMTDNFDGKGNQIMTQEGSTFEINGKKQAYADIWHRKYDTAD